MKKVRFGLLTKIILLTGLLTILTVSTSLTVNLLISYNNTRDNYQKSCEDVTDSLESVFFSSSDKENAKLVLQKLVSGYEEVRNKYQNMSIEELDDYQNNLKISLFEPAPGTMGMDYEKSIRKNYYTEAVSRMQSLCNTYKVPFSSIDLYDSEKKCLVVIAKSNISYDDNLSSIGLLEPEPEEWEIDYFNSSSETDSFKTTIINGTVMTCNYAAIDIGNANYKCFIRAQYPLDEVNESFNKQLATELIITFASAVFLVIIYAIFTKIFLLKSVERLKNSTNKFVGMMKNDETLEIVDTNVKSTDEIRELSDAFAVMQGQIITYVDNIKQAKDFEQAYKMEVDIASKIQLESLPAPVHFDKNIELRAFIKPARGVGGDFYDYFYIDRTHLACVIADVSGKGIPASLFMMRAKESLRSASMNEKDLAKVLFKVNNSLCVNNKEGFFVTAFLGVLDLKTYEFAFISAGHERPFIKRGKDCKRLEVESNFVLGLEEDFEYVQEKIKLQEGDTIVLYTDGLNEAINNDKQEFSYQGITNSLLKNDEPKQNLEDLINDLEAFEGEQEQFDDITLLAFKIRKNIVSYFYSNPTYNDIPDLTGKVEEYLDGLEPATLSKIGVVIDEVMNNIISYGKTKTNKTVTVSIEKTESGATLIFEDNSHPFNPLLKESRTIPENMEEGIVGGVGISIMKSISEGTEYSYSNNKNILVIKF